jgi:putative inorganic carbon (hco3(-)) transporter
VRDYLIIGIILGSLPVGLFRPFYGLLIYTWISYMNPHLLAWSFAQSFPVAKLSAAGVLAGVLFRHEGTTAPLVRRENVLMVVLLIPFTVSSLFAFHPELSWPKWQDMLKIILMALVTSSLLTDQRRLRLFFLVVALSLGFYGLKGGIFSLLSAGEQRVFGPGNSIIGANNAIGLALNMCLPMLWYLARNQEPFWLKSVLRLCFIFSIPAVMFTYSRASALSLGVVLLSLMLKGKKKILALGLVLLAGIAAIDYIPEKWLDRQRTTIEYEEDRSATSRLDEWVFCWRVAVDRPLTGGGFLLYSPETYSRYFPEFFQIYGSLWSAHSIYFGILAEHGFPGLLVFMSMIGCCLLSLWQMKRAVRHRTDLQWLANYSDMIQISLLGFLVNGAFVEMEYFDLVYHWVGVVASLRVLAEKELAAAHVPSVDLGREATAAAAVWQPPARLPLRQRS